MAFGVRHSGYRRQFRRFVRKYWPYAVQGYQLYNNVRQRFQGPGAPTRTRTQRRARSGVGVTDQYDRKVIYRKKRMPRRMRRMKRRFNRLVLHNSLKSVGTKSVVLNNAAEIGQSGASVFDQQFTFVGLYGQRSNASTPLPVGQVRWLNDIYYILSNDTGFTNNSCRGHFMSGVLDITMENTSQAGDDPPTEAAKLEVDVYEMSAGDQVGYGNGPWAAIAEAEAPAVVPTVAGFTSLNLTDRGVTPWDLTQFLSDLKIKIWKKTKYFLSPQQVCTYQYRDPRYHRFNKGDVGGSNEQIWNKPGVTKFFCIVAKATPGFVGPDWSLTVGYTRKYMYKIDQPAGDEKGWINTDA